MTPNVYKDMIVTTARDVKEACLLPDKNADKLHTLFMTRLNTILDLAVLDPDFACEEYNDICKVYRKAREEVLLLL